MKIYCKSCKKPTSHRQKLGGTVCNSCDIINHPVYLERLGDGRSNIANTVTWIEWTEDGRGKATHDEPQIGYSLCLDLYSVKPEIKGLEDHPPVSGFTWMTTPLTQIIEDKKTKEYQRVHFKTNNSEYILYVTIKNNI